MQRRPLGSLVFKSEGTLHTTFVPFLESFRMQDYDAPGYDFQISRLQRFRRPWKGGRVEAHPAAVVKGA